MGWLPRLKLSDRITWAVLAWIFVNLLWLRFLERTAPQWIGAVVATALGAAVVAWWPRPVEELPVDAAEEARLDAHADEGRY